MFATVQRAIRWKGAARRILRSGQRLQPLLQAREERGGSEAGLRRQGGVEGGGGTPQQSRVNPLAKDSREKCHERRAAVVVVRHSKAGSAARVCRLVRLRPIEEPARRRNPVAVSGVHDGVV